MNRHVEEIFIEMVEDLSVLRFDELKCLVDDLEFVELRNGRFHLLVIQVRNN